MILKHGYAMALYFVSYVFITSITMMNVVVAILLEKYLASTGDEVLKKDDNLEALSKIDSDLGQRLRVIETQLKEDNLRFSLTGMNPTERYWVKDAVSVTPVMRAG